MATQASTRLTIDVPSDFRHRLKIQAIAHGKTLKDHVVESLTERMQRDSLEEDELWGEMSEAAKKEDILTPKDSLTLLNRMKNA